MRLCEWVLIVWSGTLKICLRGEECLGWSCEDLVSFVVCSHLERVIEVSGDRVPVDSWYDLQFGSPVG